MISCQYLFRLLGGSSKYSDGRYREEAEDFFQENIVQTQEMEKTAVPWVYPLDFVHILVRSFSCGWKFKQNFASF